MLVFTRKRNDAIVIGDGIEIRVLRIGRDSIRLGVKAPPSVPVHRLEIYEQIREANHRAAEARARPSACKRVRKHTIKGGAGTRVIRCEDWRTRARTCCWRSSGPSARAGCHGCTGTSTPRIACSKTRARAATRPA